MAKLTNKQTEAIKDAGYEAFANGDVRGDNPHKIGSDKNIIWLEGFDEAGKLCLD